MTLLFQDAEITKPGQSLLCDKRLPVMDSRSIGIGLRGFKKNAFSNRNSFSHFLEIPLSAPI